MRSVPWCSSPPRRAGTLRIRNVPQFAPELKPSGSISVRSRSRIGVAGCKPGSACDKRCRWPPTRMDVWMDPRRRVDGGSAEEVLMSKNVSRILLSLPLVLLLVGSHSQPAFTKQTSSTKKAEDKCVKGEVTCSKTCIGKTGPERVLCTNQCITRMNVCLEGIKRISVNPQNQLQPEKKPRAPATTPQRPQATTPKKGEAGMNRAPRDNSRR